MRLQREGRAKRSKIRDMVGIEINLPFKSPYHRQTIIISFSEAQDPAAFCKALRDRKGLGPWSAADISLLAMGDTDGFPKTDLILKRALELHPEMDLAPVKPWRSYAAIHLRMEFAQSLAKSKKVNNDAAILQ